MRKLLILSVFISFYIQGLNAVLYDCFTGKPLNETQIRSYEEKDNLGNCTIDVKPCDPDYWRLVDGSCNNLDHPSFAMHKTPNIRLLTTNFSENYEPRKSASGDSLPLPRKCRTELLRTGKASDLRITQLVSYYVLFTVGDINSIHDIFNFVLNITYCCQPEGKQDYRCTPNEIPADDPVHRFSGINCLNLTRPQSFQTYGCLENGTTFERIVFQTPVFDLSNTYNILPGFIDRLRTYENGLLKVEIDNGILFPPSDPDSGYCGLNQPPRETRCHMYQSNNVVGPNMINVLFYAQHNRIAEELYKLNPCWDDDRLFYTARDINIAIAMQIYFYELLPVLFGRANMIRDGVITYDGGFRDTYDETVDPKMSDEYVYSMRWFHTTQETNMKLYDKDGCYLKTVPYLNFTTRTGYLPLDNNMQEIIQGSFRQASGAFDYTIDFDMADRVLGGLNLASDVATSDISKGRLFGFQPYVKYKELCTNQCYESFADLQDSIRIERIHRLRQIYKNVIDIDLMAGLWVENHIQGGRVPETVYCLMVEQLKRTIQSDRHWYERPNRPHAFTADQLKAIRKVTVAGFLCDAGDFVTEIQPRAFYAVTSKNPITKCSSSEIGKLDLTPWKDCSCDE